MQGAVGRELPCALPRLNAERKTSVGSDENKTVPEVLQVIWFSYFFP